METFKELVMRGATEFEQIGKYVTQKTCKLVNVEETEYYKAYHKCLLIPDMHQ